MQRSAREGRGPRRVLSSRRSLARRAADSRDSHPRPCDPRDHRHHHAGGGRGLPRGRGGSVHVKSGGADIAAGEYKQMIGRAGRYAAGEVFVIEHPENKQKALQLMNKRSPEVRSVLTRQERGLTRALLECVCLGLITSCASLHLYVRHTLVAQQSTEVELRENVEDALQFLQSHQIITAVRFEDQYLIQPTRLGRAISASSLPIEESVLVYRDLYLHQTHVSLQSNLFLVYLVTPTFVTPTPRWDVFERVAFLLPCDCSCSSRSSRRTAPSPAASASRRSTSCTARSSAPSPTSPLSTARPPARNTGTSSTAVSTALCSCATWAAAAGTSVFCPTWRSCIESTTANCSGVGRHARCTSSSCAACARR